MQEMQMNSYDWGDLNTEAVQRQQKNRANCTDGTEALTQVKSSSGWLNGE
jgi:hypothetical protein